MKILRLKWTNRTGWPVYCVIIGRPERSLSTYSDWLKFAYNFTKSANTLNGNSFVQCLNQERDLEPIRWQVFYSDQGESSLYAFMMVPAEGGFAVYGCFICLPEPQAEKVRRLLRAPASLPLLFEGEWDRACNAGLLTI